MHASVQGRARDKSHLARVTHGVTRVRTFSASTNSCTFEKGEGRTSTRFEEMPRVYNPPVPKAGPGCALGGTSQYAKRRRRHAEQQKRTFRPKLTNQNKKQKTNQSSSPGREEKIGDDTRSIRIDDTTNSTAINETARKASKKVVFEKHTPQSILKNGHYHCRSELNDPPKSPTGSKSGPDASESSVHVSKDTMDLTVMRPTCDGSTKIALGLDTRCCLCNKEDSALSLRKSLGTTITHEYSKFLQSSWKYHDLLPDHVIATGNLDNGSTTVTLKLESRTTLSDKLSSSEEFLTPVWCHSLENGKNSKSEQQQSFAQEHLISEKALRPKSSWKMIQKMGTFRYWKVAV